MAAPLIGAIAGPLLECVKEGLVFLNEKQRTKFVREYDDILTALNQSENRQSEDYTDYDLHINGERLRIFLEAYAGELRRAGLEMVRSK